MDMTHCLKAMCHTDALLWSAREIASIALPVARERHAKSVWQIALTLSGSVGRTCPTCFFAVFQAFLIHFTLFSAQVFYFRLLRVHVQ